MSVNLFLMALMPISQAVSWYLVVRHPLYASVWKIAGFYCVWALWNRFIEQQTQELGHFSMGFLAVVAYLERRNLCIAGTILVLANFGLAAYFVFTWSASKLAHVVKNSDSSISIVWAYVFKVYFASNICLWSLVLHKFWKMDDGNYQPLDTNTRR